MIKKIAILLGRKTDTRYQMSDVRYQILDTRCQISDTSKRLKKIFKGILFGILLISSIWYLGSAVTPAYANFGVTNTAGLMYSDNRRITYSPVYDTAAIEVLQGANLVFSKDVRNVRTGDASSDIVVALRGDTVEFILSATNKGPDPGKNVTIIDSIPFSTVYETGSALDTTSFDTGDMPDTISFQHMAGGEFDLGDTGTITAVKWEWIKIDVAPGDNKKVVRFKVKVQ